MKRIMFGWMLVIGMLTGMALPAKAQVNVHINISSQPLWGPVGYDYVEYYYLPDLEMYYYVPAHKFVYINGGRWVFSSTLPYYYRGYDLYAIHKVVINEPRAYRFYHVHKTRYAGYRGGTHKQVFIRSSRNPKYYVVKGHPHYGKRNVKVKPAGGKSVHDRKYNSEKYRAKPHDGGKNHKGKNHLRSAGKTRSIQPAHKRMEGKGNVQRNARSHGGGKHKGRGR